MFTKLEWQNTVGARSVALYRIARNLGEFCDHWNRCRFLEAIPDGQYDPQVVEPLVDGYLRQGRLQKAADVIDACAAFSSVHFAKLDTLKNQVRTISAFADEMTARLGRKEYDGILKSTTGRTRAQDTHFFFEWARAMALEALGQDEEALRTFCLAARLNPDSTDTIERARALRAKMGDTTPHTDVDAMLSRIREQFFCLEEAVGVPEAKPLVSVIVSGNADSETSRAIQSIKAQLYDNWELILVGLHDEDIDPRVKIHPSDKTSLADRLNIGFAASSGTYVTWIEAGCLYTPNHLQSLVYHLQSGAEIVRADCHWFKGQNGSAASIVEETIWAEPDHLLRARELAANGTPLTAIAMTRDPLEQAPFSNATPFPIWDFVLRMTRNHTVTLTGLRTYMRPIEDRSTPDPKEGADLMSFYTQYVDETRFNATARGLQNQRLNSFGLALPNQGVPLVAVLAEDKSLEDVVRCLTCLQDATLAPYEIIVIGQRGIDLAPLKAQFDRIKIKYNTPSVCYGKMVNQALAACNSDCVTIMDVEARCPEGWLSRLTWWQKTDPSIGLILGTTQNPKDDQLYASEAITQDHWVWVTRRCLDDVGGIDLTLDAPGLEWVDLALRIQLAGLKVVHTPDVPIESAEPQIPSESAQAAFTARWNRAWNTSLQTPINEHFRADIHHAPIGAAEGCRPDVPPIEVLDAAATNILVPVPWENEGALAPLLNNFRILPRGVSAWLWSEAGRGEADLNKVMSVLSSQGLSEDAMPDIRILDPHLAPDRIGGLFVAADAVYIEESWPEARSLMRKAANCGRSIIRSRAHLQQWIESLSTSQ